MQPDKPPFDWPVFLDLIAKIKEPLAQLQSMANVASSPTGGAIQPVALPLTVYPPVPGNVLPDTDPVPNLDAMSIAELLDWLDDHTVKLAPGYLGTYMTHRGGIARDIALWQAKEWGAKYYQSTGGALSHCQTLRAIVQGVPYNINVGAQWDAATRTWLDKTGRPFVAQTEWVSAVAIG